MGRGHSRRQTILGQRRNGTYVGYPTHEYALRPLSGRLGTAPSERFAEAQPLIWAVHVGGFIHAPPGPRDSFSLFSFFRFLPLYIPTVKSTCSELNCFSGQSRDPLKHSRAKRNVTRIVRVLVSRICTRLRSRKTFYLLITERLL